MDSALGWIGQIVEWMAQFIPRFHLLPPTEQGLKYKKDGSIEVIRPGQRAWHWPFSTIWDQHPVARQTDRLETQTMETQDGVTFVASGTLTYEVEDLSLFAPRVHSPLTTVVDIAMAALHDVCCEYQWAPLQEAQRKGTIKTKLRLEAQKQLKDFGIKVIKLQLNSLARARVMRISLSTAQEEN